MVTIYMKNDILSLKRDGMSNRKIALKLNISKDTVNKYVKEMNELTKLIELETDIYKYSLVITELQYTTKFNIVRRWSDEFLINKNAIENKNPISKFLK